MTKNFLQKLVGKTIIVGLISFSIHSTSTAQVFTGGNFGVNYDNNGVYVDLAPEIGYRYKIVEAGIAPFVSYKQIDKAHHYSFGSRVFSRLTLYKDIFAHAEFQVSNIEIPGTVSSDIFFDNRKWIVAMPLGVGYRYKISKNITAQGSVLYDVLLDDDSPQKNPIIRGGIVYDF